MKENIRSKDLVEVLVPQGAKYPRRMQFYKVGPSRWHSQHAHFLLKPPRAIPYAPEEAMLKAIHSLDRRSLPVIEQNLPLEDIYPWGFEPGEVHFLLHVPRKSYDIYSWYSSITERSSSPAVCTGE